MTYNTPSDLQTALELYKAADSKIIAGGTDVFPAAQQGKMPRHLIDLKSIPALCGIKQQDQYIRIGAATTWTDIARAELPAAFDGLKQAAAEVGSIQIQNAGTIGGNICNASPAADGVPPLLALDAEVELQSTAGMRRLKLCDFILGVRKTALAADEILTAILVPVPDEGEKSAFEKLGTRRYLVISITMVAANIICDDKGLIVKAKIAVGSCAPTAKRLYDLEADIVGKPPSAITISLSHLSPLAPISDVRGSGEYRLDVVAKQCARAIKRAA